MKVNYTLYALGLILILALSFTVDYYKRPSNPGLSIEFAQRRVKEVLADSTRKFWYSRGGRKKILVTTKETAVSIVEPILFDLYGKEQVLSERPYIIHKIDDYWFIAGSLPRFYDKGGGFEIILDSRDAHVLSVTHYK